MKYLSLLLAASMLWTALRCVRSQSTDRDSGEASLAEGYVWEFSSWPILGSDASTEPQRDQAIRGTSVFSRRSTSDLRLYSETYEGKTTGDGILRRGEPDGDSNRLQSKFRSSTLSERSVLEMSDGRKRTCERSKAAVKVFRKLYAWITDELEIISSTDSIHTQQPVILDEDLRAVIWFDGYDIRGQILDIEQNTVGDEFVVNSFSSGVPFLDLGIAVLGSGSYVVCWKESSKIYARIFNYNTSQGPKFQVNSLSEYIENEQILALEDGDFAIVWTYDIDGYYLTYIQLFDHEGEKIGNEFRAPTYESYQYYNDDDEYVYYQGEEEDEYDPEIIRLTNGNIVITWNGRFQVRQNDDILAVVLDSEWNSIVSKFRVSSQTSDSEEYQKSAALKGGGFVVAWEGSSIHGSRDMSIFAQIFDSSGNKIGREIQVHQITEDLLELGGVTALNDGGFVVGFFNNDNDSYVFARRYDQNGYPTADQFHVNQNSNIDSYPPMVATINGGFALTWHSNSLTGSNRLIAGRLFYDSIPSLPPSLNIPLQDFNAYLLQTFSFVVPANTFHNPSRNQLTYSARALVNGEEASMSSLGLSFDPESRAFTGTPTQQLVITVQIEVSEENGSAIDEFLITVEANSKPFVNAVIPNIPISFSRDHIWEYYLPKNAFKDSERDPIVFTSAVTVINDQEKDLNTEWESLQFDNDLGKLYGIPNISGNFTIRVYADDGLGDLDPTPLDITVEITTQGIQLLELYRIDQPGSKAFISSDDSFFWVAEGSDLKRFDLSSGNPLLVNDPSLHYSLSSSITALCELSQDRMLAGDDQGNLTLLSSSTNSLISSISLDGEVTDIYNDDDELIYVSHASSLSTIQFTTQTLEISRTIPLPKSVTSIAKTGAIVYAGTQDGLLLIDTLTDTSNDSNISDMGYVFDLQMFGDYLYVLRESELLILDISNPLAILLVNTRSLERLGTSLLVSKIDMEVIAFISEEKNGVELINTSDLLNLSFEGLYSSTDTVKALYASSTGRWGVVLKESEVLTVEIFRRDVQLEVCDTYSDPCSLEFEVQAQNDIFKDIIISEFLPTFKTDFTYNLSYSYTVQEVSGDVYSPAPDWLSSFRAEKKLLRLSIQPPESLVGSIVDLVVEVFAFESDRAKLLKWRKVVSLSIVPKHASLDSFIPDQSVLVGEEWAFAFDESVFSDADDFECEYFIGSEWIKSYDISSIHFASSSRQWSISLSYSMKENSFGCDPCDSSENSATIVFKVIAKNSVSDSDPGVSTTFNVYFRSGIILDQQTHPGLSHDIVLDNSFFLPDIEYTVSLLDTNGQSQDLPDWISYLSDESKIEISPTALEVDQDFDIRITGNNSGVEIASQFTIRVLNQPPLPIRNLQNQRVKLEQTLDYSFSSGVFYNADGDSLSYTVNWHKEDGTLTSDIPSWITFTEDTLTFSGSPSVQGSYRLSVSASDGLGGQVSTEFVIEAYNNAPLPNLDLSLQNQYDHHIGVLFSLTLPSDLFTDMDGDSLSYSALQFDGSELPSWLVFVPSSLFLFGTPSDPSLPDTSVTIQIIASDGYSSSGYSLSISITNIPPQPSSIEDQTVHIGDLFSLSLSSSLFTDPDGDELTYSVLLQDGSALPSWLTFDSSTFTIYGTPVDSDLQNTIINIRMFANDGYSSANIDFSLSIENNPPSVNFSLESQISRSLNQGSIKFKPGVPFEVILFQDSFADSDNDVLTLSSRLSNGDVLPQWLSFDSIHQEFFGTPTQEETLSVSVIAFDGYASASDTFVMEIINLPPTLNKPLQNQVDSLYPSPLAEGFSFSFQFSQDTFTDQDDSLSYTALFSENGGEWRSLDFSWIELDGNTLLGTVSTASASNTTLSVQVTASDGQKVVSDTFSLTILTPLPSATANTIHIESVKSSIEVEVFTNGPKIAVFSHGTLSALDTSNNNKTSWRLEGSPSDINYVLERVKYRPSSNRLLSESTVSVRIDGLEQEYPLSVFAPQESIKSLPIPDQRAYIDNTYTLGIKYYFIYLDESELRYEFEIQKKPEGSTDWLKFDGSDLSGIPTDPDEIGSYKLRMTVTDEFDESTSESLDLEVGYTLFQQFINLITTLSQFIGPTITILGLLVYRATIWNLLMRNRKVHAPLQLRDTLDNSRELLILRPDEEKVALKIVKTLKYQTIPDQDQLICDMESRIKELNTRKSKRVQRVRADTYEISSCPPSETLEQQLLHEDAPLVEIKGAEYHARFLFFCLKDNIYKQSLSKPQRKELDNLVKEFKQRRLNEDRVKEMAQHECMTASEWAQCKDLWTIGMPDLTKGLNSISREILEFSKESEKNIDSEMFINRMRIEQWTDRAVRIEDTCLLNDLQLHKETLIFWKIPWKMVIKEWIHRNWILNNISNNILAIEFDTSKIQISNKLYLTLLDKKGYLVFKMTILPPPKSSITSSIEQSPQIEDKGLFKNRTIIRDLR